MGVFHVFQSANCTTSRKMSHMNQEDFMHCHILTVNQIKLDQTRYLTLLDAIPEEQKK